MAPSIAPLPTGAVAPVEASAFDELARHHQITESLVIVRKLFEDLANEEADPERIREHVRQILKKLSDRERSEETTSPDGEGQDRRAQSTSAGRRTDP